MQLDQILSKQIALSQLRTKDPKVRRLFILADGKRNIEELAFLCGLDAEKGISIAESLLASGSLSIVKETRADPSHGSIAMSGEVIERLVADLAHYLGPIAAVLVSNALGEGDILTLEQRDAVKRGLAAHIDEERDREEFLAGISMLI